MTTAFVSTSRPRVLARAIILSGPAALFLWAYWPTLRLMASKWTQDPQYSHSYLVPVFALVLLWRRRPHAADLTAPTRGALWCGLAAVLGGTLLRLAGTFFFVDWFDALSVLPVLAGSTLMLGGWPAFRWAWVPMGFLIFMIPLPFFLETGLAHPLQRVATLASTYTLQTLGFPALSEGNVIILNDLKLGIVEACSGLGMLLLFFALATAVALVIRRGPIERLLVILSAAPIAVLANVLRITSTGILAQLAGKHLADLVFHDLAGWFMMPAALLLLWAELAIFAHAVVEVKEAPTLSVRLTQPALPLAPKQPAATRARAIRSSHRN